MHVQEFRKRVNKIKLGDNENKLSDFDIPQNDIIEELKTLKYNDLEVLVYRIQLTYDEVINILDLKCNPTKRRRYSLNSGI